MFYDSQSSEQKEYYTKTLKTIGSLSRLFSEGKEPYLEYRVAENLFCKAFNADNLSRSDCSADAAKDQVGIGIKTFLEKNGATIQKVAEFNGSHSLFKDLNAIDKITKIAELRNERIQTTKRIFGLDSIMYHCLTRSAGEILGYELNMDLVAVSDIRSVIVKDNVMHFTDGYNEYSFNLSKSTLYKRFHTKDILFTVPVEILNDPFEALEGLLKAENTKLIFAPLKSSLHVFLPLYSSRGFTKNVPERSGLNQWNAGGRDRGFEEVYLPIPAWIHKEYPDFFPGRDVPFTLVLPDGSEMSAKVCQDGSKALMSNPNSALGKWLLRDVLNLKEGELLTYTRLEEVGLDSVVIYKAGENRYDIDFTKIDSYETFKGAQEDESEDS